MAMHNSQQGRGNSPVQARTLEYRQAMKDFHTMFPSLAKDVIECVLRANSGHVDSTIDQLLQLTQDMPSNNSQNATFERLYYTYDDSTDSSGSLSPEEHDRLSSSEDDQPPKYTAQFEPPPPAFTFSTNPVEAFPNKRFQVHSQNHQKRYRDWNPPLLGTLPPDFLRIVPERPERQQRFPSHHSSPNRSIQSSRRMHSSRQYSSASTHQKVQSSNKQMQRRRTTGEMNVVLRQPSTSDRSPQHRMVMVESSRDKSRSSARNQRNNQHASSANSSRPHRSETEASQYVEDCKFALLLQNEEFLKELKRNETFLQELNKDGSPNNNMHPAASGREQFAPIHIDPLTEMTPNRNKVVNQDSPTTNNPESSVEEKAFKESLKNMSKSAKKSFNEIARRFSTRRRQYKTMNNPIDPVFADCDDED